MDEKVIRVVFSMGGKGGTGKTALMSSLVSWYEAQDIQPVLLDFDVENTDKSSLQNFHTSAKRFDVHADGALDEFFEVCDEEEVEVVLADLGAGAGRTTYAWFDETFEDTKELCMKFTAVGVTTNDAGAVQSILKWADHLQDRVSYLVVLNEMREKESEFEYWHDEKAVAQLKKVFQVHEIQMGARVQEFESELRNQCASLQTVVDGKADNPFLRKTKNVVRAKRYQRQLFDGFDQAAEILIP